MHGRNRYCEKSAAVNTAYSYCMHVRVRGETKINKLYVL